MKVCIYCGRDYWPEDERPGDHWPNCGDEECVEQAMHDRFVTESGSREIRGLE